MRKNPLVLLFLILFIISFLYGCSTNADSSKPINAPSYTTATTIITTTTIPMTNLPTVDEIENQLGITTIKPVIINRDMGKWVNCGFQKGGVIIINLNPKCMNNECCIEYSNHRLNYQNILTHEKRHFYWNYYLTSQQKLDYCKSLNLSYAKECFERYANNFKEERLW